MNFGRRFAPDPRDNNHPMRLMLDPLRNQFFPQGLPPGTRHYRSGPVLDQGNTGTCVGHGWAGWSQGAPLMVKPTAEMMPFALYDEFIKNDEWDDNDVDPDRQMGTSVRAGAKVLKAKGRIARYLWAESVDDIRAWHLANFGCVVLGINWKEGMGDTDRDGFIHADGEILGGHCVKTTGWNDDRDAVRIQNSWGRSWGQAGHAWISRADLEQLLEEDGEACAAIEQKI